MSTLIRPRLTEFHGLDCAQSDLDFAIPFINEDIPLYVDPFLLWKSPSYQDQALHTAIVNSFNHLGLLVEKGKQSDARQLLIGASECEEVGLGLGRHKKGRRIGNLKADEILSLFTGIEHYRKYGFTHFEEMQLYVGDISKDRISDITCTLVKSFLMDYTTQCCQELGIPLVRVGVNNVYNYKTNRLEHAQPAWLPVSPDSGFPLLLVPRRWLRFTPWINFDDFFREYCPRDESFNNLDLTEAAVVLRYNRVHYDFVKGFVDLKEKEQSDCKNDPLFKQIPVTSAKKTLATLLKLPSGKAENSDKKYEDSIVRLLSSLLYPSLDFAADQSRTDSGALIRDLIFYNNRKVDFLEEIWRDYGNRQLVFEVKNVHAVEREHLNQVNRYLDSGLGSFGVIVTRNDLSRAMFRNTVDLWSGQRKCIILLTDEDLKLMVDLFEGGQRPPLDVLKKKYIEFRRACPS